AVWGRFVAAGTARIRRALSRRTQPPRQGQRSVIPMWRSANDEARAIDPLSRTPRRASQVLPPKSPMSFFAIPGASGPGIVGPAGAGGGGFPGARNWQVAGAGAICSGTGGERRPWMVGITQEGQRLSSATAAKPVTRATAEKALPEFLTRVKRVNRDTR